MNLEYINVDGNFKVIKFILMLVGVGKIIFIFNIVYLIGKKGKKVVIVDLDLRKFKINRVFRVFNENGVIDYLIGKIDYKILINYFEKFSVYYIVVGECIIVVVNVLEV